MAQVGKNIRRFRTELNMTQQELAEKMMVTRQTISGWEQGRTEPDLESITQLSEVLQVTIEELIYGKQVSKGFIKAGWKKRFIIALIWVAITVVWFILCHKNARWIRLHPYEADIMGLFAWYYICKPFKLVFITITVLSFLRVKINLHISLKWLRTVLLLAGFLFAVVFIVTMCASWFGEGYNELRRQIFLFFNNISVHELEIIYALPTICIYLGIVKSLKKVETIKDADGSK